jgi:hypothetical protein
LQKRGYIVTPDPSDPINQAAHKNGALKEFERHSRLGFVDEEGFMAEVARLRGLGFKRVTLKTGAYGLRELAMALKWCGKAKIDLTYGAPMAIALKTWSSQLNPPAKAKSGTLSPFAVSLSAKSIAAP